jgi:16S rRNA processing protein RimM
MSDWRDMVRVGRIARPHGLRGEVAVDPETDRPDARFRVGGAVFLERDGAPHALTVRSLRFHKGRPLVGFEGVESLTAAEALGAAELRIPETDLPPPPPGSFYRHDLVGCRVRTVGGEDVGRVARVEGEAPRVTLVIDGARGEVLAPLAAHICRRIDVEARVIELDPPEGLLELNQPARRRARRRQGP